MRASRFVPVVSVVSVLLVALALLPGAPAARAEQAGSAAERVAAGSVDAGVFHTCVVTVERRARCWGTGGNGKLGYGDTEDIGDDEPPADAGNVPVGRVTAVAVGQYHSCALTTDRAVRCWGSSTNGRLGYGVFTGDVGDDETPASVGDVPLGGRAVAITAGAEHTCALMKTGNVRCWGLGEDFRLGYPSEADIGDTETPAQAGTVPLGGKATAISAGGAHTCALMESGRVRCWGLATGGRLGYGPQLVDLTPTPDERGDVPLGGRAKAISAGEDHTCALMRGGAVRCWGNGADGRLGYGSTATIGDNEPASAPGVVTVGLDVVAVSAGDGQTCVVMVNDRVRCWGQGGLGQLGDGDDLDDDIGDDEPAIDGRSVSLGGKAVAVSSGAQHTCAVLTTGRVRCWGFGSSGQLGLGDGTTQVGDFDDPSDHPALLLGAKVRVRAGRRGRSGQRTVSRARRSPAAPGPAAAAGSTSTAPGRSAGSPSRGSRRAPGSGG